MITTCERCGKVKPEHAAGLERHCTCVDPDAVTDRIDVRDLPKTERSDAAGTRKERRG